jgi:hypothetical protein
VKNKIFASGLKISFQYIAFVLLAVFAVTFVPFNLLHHHAEDEHAAILLTHHDNPSHHCELDNHFCQPEIEQDCGHEAHIQETITKCFSCEFHFIKHFESEQESAEFFRISKPAEFQVFFSEKLRHAIILQSNKGPPVLV